MVGRFLLGIGFGGLVGTGVLALVSLMAQPPRQAADSAAIPAAVKTPEVTPPESRPEAMPVPDKPADPAPARDDLSEALAEPVMPPGAEAGAATDIAPGAGPEAGGGTAPTENTTAEKPPQVADEAPKGAGSETAAADLLVPEAGGPIAPQAPQAPEALRAPEVAGPPVAGDLPVPPAASAAGMNSSGTEGPGIKAPEIKAPEASAEAPAAPEAPGQATGERALLPDPLTLPEAGKKLPPPQELAEERAPEVLADPGLPPLTPEEQALLEAISAGELPLPEPAPPVAEAAPASGPDSAPAAAELAVDENGIRRTVPDGGETARPRVSGLPGHASETEASRLPRIGDAPPVAATAEAPSESGDLPRQLYARAFENPGARPLYAIVLIDEGAAEVDREVLARLPFPVTFALDPQDPATAARAALYRAAGQEVVMLASFLPKGAQASDLEVAFAAMGAALPEAVAVMDMPGRSFQNDRPLSAMIVPVVAGQGRGLLTWNAGLNAADQVAKREDLPSAVIFRALDSENEEAPLIRRYLDRAAFKAVQDGQVMVVGRVRAETVAALLEWSLEGRAASVALAPVTALLKAD